MGDGPAEDGPVEDVRGIAGAAGIEPGDF